MQSLDIEGIGRLFADGIVRRGPFAGLRYPELTSVGSALYPKLLGSYESEIQTWIEEICGAGYTEIIDVGCAEGYYAVGLARRLPQAQVYAYDTDPEARRLCTALAVANGVADRVSVRAAFSADELSTLPIHRRGMLICDCEGGETQIFTEQTGHQFAAWDLLIETHDFLDITTSTRLAKLFGNSHVVSVIASLDDIQKAKTYDYPELVPFDLATRRTILAEHRPTIMEWLRCSSGDSLPPEY